MIRKLAALLLLAPTLAFADVYSTAVLALSPVYYWRMDASSIASETNLGSVGAGGNGNYDDGSTPHCGLQVTGIPAVTDKAVNCNNDNHALFQTGSQLANATLPVIGGNYTFTGWIHQTSADTGVFQSIADNGGDYRMEFDVASGVSLVMTLYQCGGANYQVGSAISVMSVGNWNFLAAKWTGASTTTALYTQGVSRGSTSSNSGTLCTGDALATAGARKDGGGAGPISADMDEIAWFATGVSDANLLNLYNLGITVASGWPYTVKRPELPKFTNRGYFDALVSRGYLTGNFSMKTRLPRYLGFALPFAVMPRGDLQ